MSQHPGAQPIHIGPIKPANRFAVAPMSRVSTLGDGVATARMADYYARFASGGFGLVITEGVYTDLRYSQAYPAQPGIANTAQADAWRNVADAVHAAGGRAMLQLMHGGALVQGNSHTSGTIAPSAVPPKGEKMPPYGGSGPFAVPAAATADDLRDAVQGFAAAAARARDAGFDGVEVHGANGYLIDQFLTTYTNRRTDGYGGTVAGRARLATEVIAAIRAATSSEFPVGIRLSQTKVNDNEYRWPGGADEAAEIFRLVAEAGASYLHVASEGRSWRETAVLDTGVTATGLAREVTGLPVIANGGMHDEQLSRSVLEDGLADLVSLARGALANPDWPQRIATGLALDAFDPAMLSPDVTLATQDRWYAGTRPTAG